MLNNVAVWCVIGAFVLGIILSITIAHLWVERYKNRILYEEGNSNIDHVDTFRESQIKLIKTEFYCSTNTLPQDFKEQMEHTSFTSSYYTIASTNYMLRITAFWEHKFIVEARYIDNEEEINIRFGVNLKEGMPNTKTLKKNFDKFAKEVFRRIDEIDSNDVEFAIANAIGEAMDIGEVVKNGTIIETLNGMLKNGWHEEKTAFFSLINLFYHTQGMAAVIKWLKDNKMNGLINVFKKMVEEQKIMDESAKK